MEATTVKETRIDLERTYPHAIDTVWRAISEAAETCRKALEIYPDNVDSLVQLARIQGDMGDMESAEAHSR